MEDKVNLRCRQADLAMVEEALPQAVQEYQTMAKKDVVVTIDTANWLPAEMYVIYMSIFIISQKSKVHKVKSKTSR